MGPPAAAVQTFSLPRQAACQPERMAHGAAALTSDAALRWIAAGGLALIVLIRVTGQCIREWLRLRMVRDLVMGGVLDSIKVVGGLHGCSIEIRPRQPGSLAETRCRPVRWTAPAIGFRLPLSRAALIRHPRQPETLNP
jgi:hypothetical protein